MRFDKRLNSLIGMNGIGFFCLQMLEIVLDPRDMVFVDKIAKVIERGRLGESAFIENLVKLEIGAVTDVDSHFD